MIAVSVFVGWPGLSLPAWADGDDWGMVRVSEVTKTGAKVTITFVDETATALVHWRYRATMPEGQWLGLDRVSVIGGISVFDIAMLSPGTEYELQVSLDRGFPLSDILSKNFTTLPPDPSVSEVIVENVTLTEGTVVITISNPGISSKTAFVRYRTDDSKPWSKPPITITTATGTAMKKLSGLTPGTRYEVEASLGDGFLTAETASTTFITLLPRVSSVSFEDVTTSEATVKVTIAEPGPGENKVHLRYSIVPSTQTTWIMPPPKSVVGDATEFALTSLAPNSEYEVQVSLDSAFTAAVESATFTTAALPSIGSVNMADVEQTSASAIVSIFDSDGTAVTVHLHYREMPLGIWIALQPKTSTTDTAEFTLSGLMPDIQYEVEVSPDRSFSNPLSTTFTTQDARPIVSGLTTEDVARTTAGVTVNIANPESRTTVYLHYRAQGAGAWIGPVGRTTSPATVGFTLTGLTPDTIYELEASLDDNFPARETLYATFITEPPVKVSGVSVGSRTHTGVTVTVSTDDRQDRTSVYLRYRSYEQAAWTGPETRTASSGAASFTLSGLMPDREYEIEASTDRYFPAARTVNGTFSTSPAPRISLVSVGNITDTKATVTANISRPQPRMTVYVRYRTQGTATWNAPEARITSSSPLRLTLMDLMPVTQYEVEASLDSDFSDSMSKTFTTAAKGPTVSGFGGGPMTPTVAKVIVNITDAQGGMMVYLRHRIWGTVTWNNPETRTTFKTSASFDLMQLTPGTTYEIEASLDRGFPAASTIYGTFSTSPAHRISLLSVGSITDTKVTVTANISRPQPRMTVYLRYRAQGAATWNGPEARTTSSSPLRLTLMDLMPATQYEVEASLDNDFSDFMSKTFTTAEKGPTVSQFGGGPISPTMAKVIVNITDAQGRMMVYLRYRIWGSGTWNSPETRTTSTTAASFDLMQLIPGTTYEIEASLDRGFSAVDTVSAIFTTAPAPRVAVVNVESITQTEATVTVSIFHPEEISRMVYMRYRELPEGDWSASQTETDALSVETVLSGLTPGMGYEVQASLYGAFPATDTQEQRFNTLSVKPMELATPVPTTTPTPTPTPTPVPTTTPTPTPTPTPVPTTTPTPTPTPTPVPTATPTPTPDPTLTPVPAPTSTPAPKVEPTITPSPTPSPTSQPASTVTPEPTATSSHMPTPTNTPKLIETPVPKATVILTAAPLLSPIPAPAPTPTPQAEEEKTGTDLALVITIVTLALALTLVIGFFVYRRRMEP